MLNNTRKATFLLALLLTLFGGVSGLKAQTNSFPGYLSSQKSVTVSAGLVNGLGEAYTPTLADMAQMQSSSSNGGSKETGPGATSDVEFLGMDYGTAITVLVILVVMLLLIVGILLQVSGQISKMQDQKDRPDQRAPAGGIKQFISGLVNFTRPVWYFVLYRLNPTIGVLTVIGILVVILMFSFYQRAQDLGTQIGYAPD